MEVTAPAAPMPGTTGNTPQTAHKAIAAAVALIVQLLVVLASSGDVRWSAVAGAVLTVGGTFGVWRIPNRPASTSSDRGQIDLVLIIAVAALVLVLLVIFGAIVPRS